jgi:nucleoside-diphosphate-sugar epimerase
MKVAVTGASGFIGRHVLADLDRHKVEIYAVTRNAKGLQDLYRNIKIIEMDISIPDKDCFVKMGSPDVLIHLAWDGLSNYSSLHHFESELPKHYNFLKISIEAGLSSLLVAGTCLEYGMQAGPLAETNRTCPTNPYGFAKDALHRQLEFLKSVTPFKLTWGRLFYMYGEGQSPGSLYSQLKNAVSLGHSSFNMSGGQQLRDYLPVSEVAQGIVQMALSRRDIGTVNICSGEPVSVRSLVEKWLKANNWEIQLNLGYYPYQDYEPMAFWGNTSKFHEILRNGLC